MASLRMTFPDFTRLTTSSLRRAAHMNVSTVMNELKFYFDFFNTREIAAIIWVVTIFIIIMSYDKSRRSIIDLLKAFFNRYILIPSFLMLLYVALAVLFSYQIGLWKYSLIKDTLYWVFGTGFIYLFRSATNADNDDHYFKNLILENLKLALIIEFIVNLYTFSLWIELIMFPVIIVVFVANTLADKKEELLIIKKITDGVIVALGITLLFATTIKAIADFNNFAAADNLRALLNPIYLSIALVPFLYIFVLAITYDSIYKRVNLFTKKDQNLARFAKRKILFSCHVSLRKLTSFKNKNTLSFESLKDKEAVSRLLDTL